MKRMRPIVCLVATLVVLTSEKMAAQHAEVQIGRPCSRADLTHVAARGGYLAVSQPAANTVAVYDISTDHFALGTTIGGAGKNASQFDTPAGVAIDVERQRLYVADSNNDRIQIFRLSDPGAAPKASFAKSFGRQGSAAGELDRPTALSVDARGNLYVLESDNLRVQVFSPDLQSMRQFGNAETLRNPLALVAAASGEVVYVVDAGLRQIQAFSSDGNLRGAVGKGRSGSEAARAAGMFFYPTDVAISNDGSLLVTDCGDHVVQRFDSHGAALTPWGEFGVAPGTLHQPRAVAVDERDRVFLLDFSSRRAQVFSPTGAFSRWLSLVPSAQPTASK